jgi:hypothetical protein
MLHFATVFLEDPERMSQTMLTSNGNESTEFFDLMWEHHLVPELRQKYLGILMDN